MDGKSFSEKVTLSYSKFSPLVDITTLRFLYFLFHFSCCSPEFITFCLSRTPLGTQRKCYLASPMFTPKKWLTETWRFERPRLSINFFHVVQPENYVFVNKLHDSPLQVIDFGCALVVEDEELVKDVCGRYFMQSHCCKWASWAFITATTILYLLYFYVAAHITSHLRFSTQKWRPNELAPSGGPAICA